MENEKINTTFMCKFSIRRRTYKKDESRIMVITVENSLRRW